MKAIHYRGQNDFYLFDKPEYTDFEECKLGRYAEYDNAFQTNLSAGKKIINPAVLGLKELESLPVKYVYDGKILKPGDIFALPNNIESIEDPSLMPGETIVVLKLKQEPTETQDELYAAFIKELGSADIRQHHAQAALKSKFIITRNQA